MEILPQRFHKGSDSPFNYTGCIYPTRQMILSGQFTSTLIELTKWKTVFAGEKLCSLTAVPAGEYPVTEEYTPRFNQCYDR